MLRIAIVEDEETYIRQIEEYIERYGKENQTEMTTVIFRDGTEIIENYQNVYDIIFFDIAMPQMDGMEAAGHIRELDEDVVMVFITNMPQYAVRGYEVGALDFVIKPLQYPLFAMRLTRAIKRAQKRNDEQILLNLADRVKRLSVRQIYYVEVQNKMLHYHTDEGEFVLRGTMQGALNELAQHHFVRCNYWYIVNLMHVSEVRKEVVVVAGDELVISRRNKTAFLTALTEYMGGGHGWSGSKT